MCVLAWFSVHNMNTSVEEGVRWPPEVTGGCEPPDVGTGNWVHCRRWMPFNCSSVCPNFWFSLLFINIFLIIPCMSTVFASFTFLPIHVLCQSPASFENHVPAFSSVLNSIITHTYIHTYTQISIYPHSLLSPPQTCLGQTTWNRMTWAVLPPHFSMLYCWNDVIL